MVTPEEDGMEKQKAIGDRRDFRSGWAKVCLELFRQGQSCLKGEDWTEQTPEHPFSL